MTIRNEKIVFMGKRDTMTRKEAQVLVICTWWKIASQCVEGHPNLGSKESKHELFPKSSAQPENEKSKATARGESEDSPDFRSVIPRRGLQSTEQHDSSHKNRKLNDFSQLFGTNDSILVD